MKHITYSLLAALVLALPASVEAQFEDMTTMIPGDANIIVFVNEKELASSEYAMKNNWATEYQKAFDAGVAVIPPHIDDYMLAASVDLEQGIQNWEIALAKDHEGGIDVSNPARRYKSAVDQIAGKDVALLPGDTFLVQFSDKVAGAISPANRQRAARWIRTAKSSKVNSISPYLRKAANYANKFGTEIVIALDLTDAFGSAEIEQIASTTDNPEQLKALLVSLKGVTLGITVDSQIQGKILVDFDTPADAFLNVGKDLVIGSLGDYGMMISDLNGWEPKVVGNRFELSGKMGEQGMRRLFSLAQPTGASSDHYASDDDGSMSSDQRNIRYVRSVLSLQRDFEAHEVDAILLQSTWLNKTIDKIESLSVVDIDDELVEFSTALSDEYRSILDVIADERAYVKIQSSKVRGSGYRYRGSRYGYYGYSQSAEKSAIRQRNKAEGAKQVKQKLQSIEVMVRDFRNEMSKRYGIDF